MSYKILPVILAGGQGARLWPLSSNNRPKQFLSFFSEHSLLQETLIRLQGLQRLLPPLIISSKFYATLLKEQIDAINIDADIILEPLGRNTAPAITLAALCAKNKYQDTILLILPSDHFISDPECLHIAIDRAILHASNGKLITFGIAPSRPETSYGYIKVGTAIDDYTFMVEKFTEKPRQNLAVQYLKDSQYYWNSGMFLLQTSTLLNEIKMHAPHIFKNCQITFDNRTINDDICEFKRADFECCPTISIDYALMEKTRNTAVVPINIGWSDIGSFEALYEIGVKDEIGNVINGKQVVVENCSNCYIQCDHKLIVKNLHNMAIVHTKDGSLARKLSDCSKA